MRVCFHLIVATLVLSIAAQSASAGDITAGPMVGHVTDKSARIWMQLAVAKQVSITCFETSRGGAQISTVSEDVQGPWPFVCDLPVSNLRPNTTYRIEVKLDGEPIELPPPGVIIRTAPPPGEEATFSIAFGSSIAGDQSTDLFKAVKDSGPRAFFLGDSGHLPAKLEQFPTTRRAAFRSFAEFHSNVRKLPELQDLFRTTATYGIWGEHDFGADNSGKDWVFAKESQAAFQRFWANPDWGTPENPGCYFNFTLGDADFFMLDARMFRDPLPGGKTMLGDVQLEWLKKSLKDSTATFKIIGCASRLLADDGGSDEWARYPEQHDFLAWLAQNQITGVMFISGGGADRHYGELTIVKSSAPGSLLELTSSGLMGKTDPAADNPNRAGPALTDNNFATLDFVGQREHRFIRLRLHDAAGKVRLEQTVYVAQRQ